jgi:hypothetical protein
MRWLAIFNGAFALAAILAAGGRIPREWYEGAMRGLHNTIGITTPTERQMRWTLVVWLLSAIVIVDAMALLLVYAF